MAGHRGSGRTSSDRPLNSRPEPLTPPGEAGGDARAARASRLATARQELAAAAERGEGGRGAMRQYSHRMDRPA